MEFEEIAEKPRHIIVSARVSPMVELARWLFERYRLTYHEEAHAPILHVIATRRRGGGREVPVVVGPEGIWDGARAVLDGLDAKSRPGQRLYGESDDARAANRALIDGLLARLLLTVRRLVYFHLLPHRTTLYPAAVDGAPLWERAFVFLLYPIWRRLMARGLDLSPQLVEEAPAHIREACDLIEAELRRSGGPFVGGEEPNAIDIVFSALMAPDRPSARLRREAAAARGAARRAPDCSPKRCARAALAPWFEIPTRLPAANRSRRCRRAVPAGRCNPICSAPRSSAWGRERPPPMARC